jgi:hypothetical protein
LGGLLTEYAKEILLKILVPSAIWRVGKANIKVRKGAVVNIIKLI